MFPRRAIRLLLLLAVFGGLVLVLTPFRASPPPVITIDAVLADGSLWSAGIRVGSYISCQPPCSIAAGVVAASGAPCIVSSRSALPSEQFILFDVARPDCPRVAIPAALLPSPPHADARDAFRRVYLWAGTCESAARRSNETLFALIRQLDGATRLVTARSQAVVRLAAPGGGDECAVQLDLDAPPPLSDMVDIRVVAPDMEFSLDVNSPMSRAPTWWLCASLPHQRYITDALEAVMFADPLRGATTVPHPFSPSAPRGHLARAMALKAVELCAEAPRACFGDSDVAPERVEADEVMMMPPPNGRHVTALVQLSAWRAAAPSVRLVASVHVEWDGSGGLSARVNDFCVREGNRVVYVTAVGGREERLREQMAQHAANAAQGADFAVCLVDFVDINHYNASSVSRALLPPSVELLVAPMRGVFMKAAGLSACFSLLRDDDIAFVLDVDMTVDERLAHRLRMYVERGTRYYSPIVHFNLFDDRGRSFDGPVGWATMGTGMLGAFVSDIRRLTGASLDTLTFRDAHGWEDTDFFFRMRQSGAAVVRHRQSRLAHVPHPRGGAWGEKSTSHRAADAFGCGGRAQLSPPGERLCAERADEPRRGGKETVVVGVTHGSEYAHAVLEAVMSPTLARVRVLGTSRLLTVQCGSIVAVHVVAAANATATATMPLHPLYPPVLALAAGRDSYFMSEGGAKRGDVWEAALGGACGARSVRVVTGHEDHPGKTVREGALSVAWRGTRGRGEAQERLWRGEAVVDVEEGACIESIRVEVTRDQREWVVISSLEVR